MPAKPQPNDTATFASFVAPRQIPKTPTVATEGKFAGLRQDRQSFRLAAGRIRPDADQVRRIDKSADDPELQQLAESIAADGLRNYPEVRWVPDEDIYELVSGERRFTAMTKILHWDEIPVRVIEVSDQDVVWLQLHENIHRKDLHPLDLAAAVYGLAEQQHLTANQIADKLHKNRTYVQKLITIAKQLSPDATELFRHSAKTTHLDTIYELTQYPADQQAKLADQILTQGLTRRDLRRLSATSPKEDAAEKPKRRRTNHKKPAPYTRTIKSARGASVTVRFRKARVTHDQVIDAVATALQILQEERQAKAA